MVATKLPKSISIYRLLLSNRLVHLIQNYSLQLMTTAVDTAPTNTPFIIDWRRLTRRGQQERSQLMAEMVLDCLATSGYCS